MTTKASRKKTMTFRRMCSCFIVISSLFFAVLIDKAPQADVLANTVAEETAKRVNEKRKVPRLSKKAFDALEEAQNSIEAGQFEAAENALNQILTPKKKSKLNRYELANVYNTYAYLRYAVEDYNGALNFYQKVIDQRPEIPLALEINTLYTVAQLYFIQENWQKGIDTLNTWMSVTDTPSTNAYSLLASGYFQLKEYDKSLANIQIAIDREEAAGQLPKEQWYNLMEFNQCELDDECRAKRQREAEAKLAREQEKAKLEREKLALAKKAEEEEKERKKQAVKDRMAAHKEAVELYFPMRKHNNTNAETINAIKFALYGDDAKWHSSETSSSKQNYTFKDCIYYEWETSDWDLYIADFNRIKWKTRDINSNTFTPYGLKNVFTTVTSINYSCNGDCQISTETYRNGERRYDRKSSFGFRTENITRTSKALLDIEKQCKGFDTPY